LVDLYKLSLDGSGQMDRCTLLIDYSGCKATPAMISDDGMQPIFQIGKPGDEAKEAHSLFHYDFGKAE
jgi:hypothetical protein